MDLMDLYCKVTLDTSDYEGGVDSAKQKTNGLKSAMSGYSDGADKAGKATAGLSDKLSAATIAMGQLIARAAEWGIKAVANMVKAGIEYNAQMETYTTNFTVMLGSAEAAANKVDELKKLAASTPFEMSDLADATQTLLAFNISADDSSTIISRLGDISLGNSEKLNSLTRAYGQMSSANKVSLEKIQIMIEAGYNPLLDIQERTGESMESLYDRISNGTLTMDELDQAMVDATSAGGQFYEGMQQASQTFDGQVSTLKDNVNALIGEVFSPVSEGLTKQVLPAAITAIGTLTTAYQENGMTGMAEAAGKIVDSGLKTFAEKLPDWAASASASIDAFTAKIASGDGEAGRAIGKVIVALLQAAAKLLPSLLKLGVNMIGQLVIGLVQSIPDLVAAVPGIVTSLVQGFDALLADIMNIGVQIVNGIYDGIVGMATEFYEKVKGFFSGLVDKVKEVLGIHSPSKVFAEIGKNTIAGFINGVDGQKDALQQSMQKSVDIVVAGYEDALTEAKKRLDQYEDVGDEAAAALESAYIDSLEKAKEQAENFGTEYVNQLTTASDGIQALAQSAQGALDELEKSYDDVVAKQESMAKSLEGYGNLTEKTDDGGTELSNLRDQVSTLEQYGQMMEDLKERGASDALMSEVAGMSVDDALAYGRELLSKSKTDFNDYLTWYDKKQETARKIAEKYYSGELDALKTQYNDKLGEAMSTLQDTSIESGVDTIDGLITGMASKEDDLYIKAKTIADNITATINTALGIASPSKVFAKIGQYMAAGLGVGWDKSFSVVQDSISGSLDFGTATVGFAESAAGKSAGGIVTGLRTANNDTGGTYNINLTVDGKTLASVVFDPLRDVSKQRGVALA